jgi:AAA+ superfamily ATPase
MMNHYLPRICDELLQDELASSGAVLIEGAKWCGKTSAAQQAAKSVLYMQDPDRAASNLAMADTKPSLLLKGEVPRLIDEWQMAPVLWDAVRFEIDRRGLPGQFILTGSAVPVDGATAHTGTGRFARLLMRPMSLYESRESNGTVSLHDLFNGKHDLENEALFSIEQYAFAICRGGWPAALSLSPKHALKTAVNYVEAVINMDFQRVDGSEKNPERVRALLRSLARNISTLASGQTIMEDMQANDNTVSDKTLSSYMNVLRRIFVVEDQLAWQPSMRSRTALRSSSKRQLVDPSIATAVMRATPEKILEDFNSFGFLFEALCTRDMRIYAQANDGSVFHYRDKSGLEADMIVALNDGRWGAVEVKLGSCQIEEAAKNLLALKAKINLEKMGNPAFLLVLTGGQYAYKRPDGVLVAPLACMKH